MKRSILPLPPNRTRRNYRGGRLLDAWEGRAPARDGDRPEDWLASTTPARNPGLPPIEQEGLAAVELDGRRLTVAELFAAAPEHWLGAAHAAALGPQLGFLAKFLDSAMRLHVQAHPTRAFARRRLNSRWGKLETYVILAVRPESEPYLRLGFQRAPSPAEWRRIVLEQDLAAMDACFDKVPVRPGEVWYIPGGVPHAIGPGLLVLETMEPTDLVVRCEFEREGIVVPPEARFMGRDPEFALGIFDLTAQSVAEVTARLRVAPRRRLESATARVEELIGPEHTDCFAIERVTATGPARYAKSARVHLGIVTRGRGRVAAGAERLDVQPGAHFLLPAACEAVDVLPAPGEELEWVAVKPGDGEN